MMAAVGGRKAATALIAIATGVDHRRTTNQASTIKVMQVPMIARYHRIRRSTRSIAHPLAALGVRMFRLGCACTAGQSLGVTADNSRLLAAVQMLREVVSAGRFPLDVTGVDQARRGQAQLVAQLDDYVLPRLRDIDAPLLAVVGGSTGAGKSTLVNSLLRRTVSRSGVLRPTTRSCVLVHNPADAFAFSSDRVLPGLARVSGDGEMSADPPGGDPREVRLVASDAIPAGLALLDAPDIDSVVRPNRELARQLLAAADLWLFVTTAARYADAVPWDLLEHAAERGTSVAIVLDRVPSDAMEEVRAHLAAMLAEHGLGSASLFTVLETQLDAQGLLPIDEIDRLASWLDALARDAGARGQVIRATLSGALRSLRDRSAMLADAAEVQSIALDSLAAQAGAAYAQALSDVEHGLSDGSLLRGEVLARWQEFVGTGEMLRHVEASIGRLRDRITAALRGHPPPARDLGQALQTGIASLVIAEGQGAASATSRGWRQLPGGPRLVAAHPELVEPSPEFTACVERLVRDWQGDLLELVRAEGQDRRTAARVASFGVNTVAVILMLIVFSQTAGLSGIEIGVAGGSAVLGQRLLEAIFGDQAVRQLAALARRSLIGRVHDLYDQERSRFDRAVAQQGVDPDLVGRIRQVAASVEAAL